MRAYISRVENGHTVPALETLEKFVAAFEIRMYQRFYDGTEKPPDHPINKRSARARLPSIVYRHDAHMMNQFRALFAKMSAPDRWLLFHIAKRMAVRHSKVN